MRPLRRSSVLDQIMPKDEANIRCDIGIVNEVYDEINQAGSDEGSEINFDLSR